MKRKSSDARRFALGSVAAATLLLTTAPDAWALGLGRLAVQSALGEALRAEIDVTSLTPEESANLRARVAPPETYRGAGVDYNAVLPGTQVVLQRRADGRPYLRVTSDRAVQEPFVDVILEITWSTGRLVREYTLLIDPPSMARAPAPMPATPATPAVIGAAPLPRAANPVPQAPPPQRSAERRPANPATAEPQRAAPPPVAAPPVAAAPTATQDEYRVRSGDSLSRIASRTQRPGVSLDQMLVSLYRSNPDAFIGNNMNRLKSGVVLAVPGAAAAQAIAPAEARQVIQAQSSDFGAYRQRLAGAVPAARTEANARQASGQLQASVEDRGAGAVPAPDKLTLSKGAAATGQSAAVEDRISRERERNAASTRVAELSKNVAELKSLSGATAATAAAPATPATATAAPGPGSVSPAPAASPQAAPSILVPMPPIVVAQAPSPPAPAVAPAPPASASATLPPARPTAGAAARAATPLADEPSLFDSLVEDNPLALGLGALAVLALAGLGIYRYSRRPKLDSSETSFLESRLQPDSFFGVSGGQRIDTRETGGAASSMSYSLSQLDAIGDVDPVAEADVYLAYGRDLQAEEILKEAMRSNPERLAIRTKLLEVYAKRRDTKGFELLATQLFALTRGEGEDWAKAQELGAQIDPENPLFQPGGAPLVAKGDGGQLAEPLGASTMPQSILPTPTHFGDPQDTAPAPMDSPNIDLDLDMDLDVDLDSPDTGQPTRPSPLMATTQTFGPRAAASEQDTMSLDFTLPGPLPPPSPAAVSAAAASTARRQEQPTDFDISGISLDFDGSGGAAKAGKAGMAAATKPTDAVASDFSFADSGLTAIEDDDDPGGDPLSRKLELAEEFHQIGDTDGARDLLEEVVAGASGNVKVRAQRMLDSLA